MNSKAINAAWDSLVAGLPNKVCGRCAQDYIDGKYYTVENDFTGVMMHNVTMCAWCAKHTYAIPNKG